MQLGLPCSLSFIIKDYSLLLKKRICCHLEGIFQWKWSPWAKLKTKLGDIQENIWRLSKNIGLVLCTGERNNQTGSKTSLDFGIFPSVSVRTPWWFLLHNSYPPWYTWLCCAQSISWLIKPITLMLNIFWNRFIGDIVIWVTLCVMHSFLPGFSMMRVIFFVFALSIHCSWFSYPWSSCYCVAFSRDEKIHVAGPFKFWTNDIETEACLNTYLSYMARLRPPAVQCSLQWPQMTEDHSIKECSMERKGLLWLSSTFAMNKNNKILHQNVHPNKPPFWGYKVGLTSAFISWT